MNPDQLLLKRLESNANAIASKYALYTPESKSASTRTPVRHSTFPSDLLDPDDQPSEHKSSTMSERPAQASHTSQAEGHYSTPHSKDNTLNDSSILMAETISFIKDNIEKKQDPSSDQILEYINQLIKSRVSPSRKNSSSPPYEVKKENELFGKSSTQHRNKQNEQKEGNDTRDASNDRFVPMQGEREEQALADHSEEPQIYSEFHSEPQSNKYFIRGSNAQSTYGTQNSDHEYQDENYIAFDDEDDSNDDIVYEMNNFDDGDSDTTFGEAAPASFMDQHIRNGKLSEMISSSSNDAIDLQDAVEKKLKSPSSRASQSPHNTFSFDSPRNLQSYNFHSPTGSGTIRSSTSIIRSVLNNTVSLDQPSKNLLQMQNDYQNTEEGYDSSSTTAEDAPAEVQIPRPPTDQSEEKIIYYLKYLTNKSQAVRSDAVRSLKEIYLSILNGSRSIDACELNFTYTSIDDLNILRLYTPTIVDELLLCLEEYNNQDDACNIMIIESLGLMGEKASPSIPLLIRMLRDSSLYALYESILNALFSMGKIGLESLLDAALAATSEWDSYILTHIANHPWVQENIIVPSLIRESQVGDNSRRLSLLRALAALGSMASEKATSILLNVLISGALNRKEIATIIRYCGPQGEQMLTYLMSQNHNPRIRACAAFAFGAPVSYTSNLRVIANTDFTALFTSSPRLKAVGFDKDISNLKQPIQSLSSTNVYLLFDARELIAALRRQMSDGSYQNLSSYNYKIDPKLTAFLLEIQDQNRAEYKEDHEHTLAQNLSNSLEETSLQMLKSSIRSTSYMETKPQKKIQIAHEIPERSTIRALGEAVLDAEETVRIAATYAIGAIGMPHVHSVIGSLCAALKDPSNKVRAQSVYSIGMLSSGFKDLTEKKNLKSEKEIISLMLPLAKNLVPLLRDSHYNVRFQVIRSIREYGHVYEYDEQLYVQILKELTRVLRDGTVNRNEVAETQVSLGDRGIYQLMDILRHETHHNSKVRMSAAHGLAFSPIEKTTTMDGVVETLFHASNDRIPLVRRTVIHTLGVLSQRAKESLTYLRAQSLLPFMYSFLKDPEKCVRETAAEVLARAGPRGELLLVEGVLKDSNPIIRCSAGYGLMHVGPKCVRTLLLALNDKDPHVSRAVAYALEQIGAPAIVNSLKDRPKSAQLSVLTSVKDILLIIQLIPNAANLNKLLHRIKDSLEENLQDSYVTSDVTF